MWVVQSLIKGLSELDVNVVQHAELFQNDCFLFMAHVLLDRVHGRLTLSGVINLDVMIVTKNASGKVYASV